MTPAFLKTQKLTDRCEGGYVNSKSDRGKETLFGVSRPNNPNWKGWAKVDVYAQQYGRGTPTFIKLVNSDPELKQWAHELYYEKYWQPVRGDELPWELATVVYDMGVNSGTGTAIKMLTKVLAKMGCGTERDRVLRDEHIDFINDLMTSDSYGELMLLWFLKRKQKYEFICDTYSDQVSNWDGWMNRLCYLSQELMGGVPDFLSNAKAER